MRGTEAAAAGECKAVRVVALRCVNCDVSYSVLVSLTSMQAMLKNITTARNKQGAA